MRILFLTRSFNSLAQRLYLDLTALGHEVAVELDIADSVAEDDGIADLHHGGLHVEREEHAIGLGLDLACVCDMRVAADSAKMAASFIKVGIIPGDGGAWTLQKLIGYPKAAELFLTGRTFDAAYAQSIGLVGNVVPAAELMDKAMALAEEIAANSPRALRLTKRLLREAQHGRAGDVLELSAAFQALVHETADHKEAVNALLEKRAPVFTGD
jgi:enoyl-CoA hydratase/carnithine racemase